MEGDVPRYTCILTFCIIAAAALCPEALMPKAHGLAESTGPDGSNAQAVHGLGQTGQDVNVGLISVGNARITHEAFKDSNGIPHAFSYDFTGDGTYTSNHDTWVAGIVASRGDASHPNDIGVAPGVDIHSARVFDANSVTYFHYLRDALQHLVTNHNCRVIVTGIQLTETADGQSNWTLLYDYYGYLYNVVFANPAGKDSNNPTIFGDGYNGITTGGLVVTESDVYLKIGTNSNIGPTEDGRRKPDLAAPSQNQTMPSGGSDTSWHTWTYADGATSLSTPHTAGTAALLLGLADETPNTSDNQNEVIKAVIVNSTFPNIYDNLGNPTNPTDPNNTWHRHRGYGRIDALKAYELLNADQVAPDDPNITQQKGWAFDILPAQQVHTYTICAQRHYRLAATLSWNRRIEWIDEVPNGKIDPNELYPHLADLDLRIYEPNEPNAIFSEENNGLDPNDNLEKCDILLAVNGNYTVKIVNDSNNGEIAGYGLAFKLRPPIIGDFAPLDYIVDYADLATLAQQWLWEGPDLEADLIGDGIINLADFAEFANYWLETDPAYYQQQ